MLILTPAHGQFDKIKGTWISNSSDLLIINDIADDKSNSNVLCTINKDEGMAFYILGDTLSFQSRYVSSATNYKKQYIDRYDLLILEQTDSFLTVKPASTFSKEFFRRDRLKFIKQEFNKDTSIIFEKIIYHTTNCPGKCRVIDLEIDSSRNINFKGVIYKDNSLFNYEIDTLKSGQFIGILNDSLQNELIEILQTCNLRTLTFPETNGADAPITTLIIYFNGQKKYLKSMFPPTITYKLIDYLYHVNEETDLTRTNNILTIEE